MPSGVPLVDLLPDLAAVVGDTDLDAEAAHLVTTTGQVLRPDLGLGSQGVVDGAVLHLAQTRPLPVVVYDDPVEAVHDLRSERGEAQVPWGWAPASAALLLTSSAACLALAGPKMPSAIGVGGIGVLLTAMSTVASRSSAGVSISLPGWSAAGCGATCAVLFLPAGAALATQVTLAGLGGLVPAVLDLLIRGSARTPMLPVAVVTVAVGLGGLAMSLTTASPPAVTVALLVAMGLAVPCVPALAVRVSAIDPNPGSPPVPGASHPVDVVRLESAVRMADEITVLLYAGCGLGLVVLAPVAARSGAAGAGLVVAVAVLILLQASVDRSTDVARAALMAGSAAILGVVGSAAWVQPSWRGPLAAGLLAAGLAAWARSWPGGARTPGWDRLLDVVEAGMLASLLPLATVGSGLFETLRG